MAYGEVGKAVSTKCDRVVKNNPGYENIVKIKDVIVGKEEVELERNIAQHAVYFKFAPVTSVEVERTFSKTILSDRRLSLTTENLNKMLIISCNNV